MARISVAIGTYNGADYLEEQLESLAGQTRRPDEILLYDDGSGDGTAEILERFAQGHPGLRCVVRRREQNAGFRQNFYDALRACTGELIFLCDQDDIWMADKVERMARLMEEHGEISLLACNYTRLLPDGQKQEHSVSAGCGFCTLRPAFGEAGLYRVCDTRNLLTIPLPGCTYCVRRSFLERCLPHWVITCPHDAVLWRYAVVTGSGYVLEEPLILWRKHETSAWKKEETGGGRRHNREEALKWRRAEETDLLGLTAFLEAEGIGGEVSAQAERNLRWVRERKRFYETRNPFGWVGLLRYRDLYAGMRQLAGEWKTALNRG